MSRVPSVAEPSNDNCWSTAWQRVCSSREMRTMNARSHSDNELKHDLVPQSLFCSVSEETGEYVVIEHADAIAAISHCIAAYLMAFPQAAQCDPVELQKALSQTIKVC